jgi:hypothetical protein
MACKKKGTWILSISNETERNKLVAFRGQFCHFKVFYFSFRQKYPQKVTNLFLSISNEMERIQVPFLQAIQQVNKYEKKKRIISKKPKYDYVSKILTYPIHTNYGTKFFFLKKKT